MLSANAPRPTAFKNWVRQIHLLAAPRSGGHFIRAWLQTSVPDVRYRHWDEWESDDCSNIMLVRLYRRDLFRQCLSHAVGKITGIYEGYKYLDNHGDLRREFNDIEIPTNLFGNALWNTLGFHKDFENIGARYREHLCIYYEDWRQSPEAELKKIGLKQRTKKVRLPTITPINWQKNIVNYRELQDFFNLAMLQVSDRRHGSTFDIDPITMNFVMDYVRHNVSSLKDVPKKQKQSFDLRAYTGLRWPTE